MNVVDLEISLVTSGPDPGPADVVTVLAVSTNDEEHRRLESIFKHSRWRLLRSRSAREALELLRDLAAPVVIADTCLPDQGWRQLLASLLDLPHPAPRLVVASRLAEDTLWQDVLSSGGYNVLEIPYESREVFWVVSHAWRDWKAERERRGVKAAGAN